MRLKVSSAIRRPFCLGLNVLILILDQGNEVERVLGRSYQRVQCNETKKFVKHSSGFRSQYLCSHMIHVDISNGMSNFCKSFFKKLDLL